MIVTVMETFTQMNMEYVLVKHVSVKMVKIRQKTKRMNKDINYYFTGTFIILITLLALFGGPRTWGDTTQTNTSGTNTSIEGGYESTTTTTYESGSETTSTTTNTTN